MTILLNMGTRPEIIKMAPVVKALDRAGLQAAVLHTGQHEEMAWPLYEFFEIKPQHVIKLQRTKAGLNALSGELQSRIDNVIEAHAAKAFLVHGDTTSALMGALAAFHRHIPVGHVEAGLRSGNIEEPFPEEMNRQLIGRLASWHFAPTLEAKANLLREDVGGQISVVGNTAVDAVLWARQHLKMTQALGKCIENAAQQWYKTSDCKQLVVVTAHRRENWGEPLSEIANAVSTLLIKFPQLAVVWPVHLNPTVKLEVERVHALQTADVRKRWYLTQPLEYAQLVDLVSSCQLLLTDSGGIQEEAVSLNKPVLILRNVTERPEVVKCGIGRLVGTDKQVIVDHASEVLSLATQKSWMIGANPFGDGTSGEKIAHLILQSLNERDGIKEAA